MIFVDWLKFKPTPRKLRLFACACAHTIDLPDPRSRAAVEVAERFADGLVTEEELSQQHPLVGGGGWQGKDIAFICLMRDSQVELNCWLANTPACPQEALVECIGGPWVKCKKCRGSGAHRYADFSDGTENRSDSAPCFTCHGVGCVPARVTLCGRDCNHGQEYNVPDMEGDKTYRYNCPRCAAILAWNGAQQPCERCSGKGIYDVAIGWEDGSEPCSACAGRGHTTVGTVRRMAESIYANRTWADLPILRDALLEAGCANEIILRHCCEATQHARGCWAIDAILGKS